MSNSLIMFINFIFLLPISSLGFYFVVKKLLNGKSEFSWSIFYTVYFTFLFYFYFLPFDFSSVFTENKQNLLTLLNTIELNPFTSLNNRWISVIHDLKMRNVESYVQFFIKNVGNFLVLMPLTNFLYSLYPINRKECFSIVFIFAVIIEFFQFLLIYFFGQTYTLSILDIMESFLGAAFFLALSHLMDHYSNKP